MDNIIGDYMKKYLLSIISSMIIGYFMASYLFKQYNYDTKITSVFNNSDVVFLIQQGVYTSIDSMKENMTSFSYYIYNLENDKYYAFIGITKNQDNLTKLEDFYKSKGYSIISKQVDISNKEYINILDQYDNLLSTTDNGDTINAIMMQALTKYEEMVINGG